MIAFGGRQRKSSTVSEMIFRPNRASAGLGLPDRSLVTIALSIQKDMYRDG